MASSSARRTTPSPLRGDEDARQNAEIERLQAVVAKLRGELGTIFPL